MKGEKKTDGKTLLLGELLTRGAKQKKAEVERRREEFRSRIGLEPDDE